MAWIIPSSFKYRSADPITLMISRNTISFRVFRPKNACQAPKPPKPLKQNKIELAY